MKRSRLITILWRLCTCGYPKWLEARSSFCLSLLTRYLAHGSVLQPEGHGLSPVEVAEAPSSFASQRVEVIFAPEPEAEPEPAALVSENTDDVVARSSSLAPATAKEGGPLVNFTGAAELSHPGREQFDQGWTVVEGLGVPGFNGASCATCHMDPVVGGAGNVEFNVLNIPGMRMYQASRSEGEQLTLMRAIREAGLERISRLEKSPDDMEFGFASSGPTNGSLELSQEETEEMRDRAFGIQTPSLLGVGRIDRIPDAEILSRADPEDLNGDGIKGVANIVVVNGSPEVGRFGWKADVPRLADFVCRALGGESGITAPDQGRAFGLLSDGDRASDPEITQVQFDDLVNFIAQLPPPETGIESVRNGENLFHQAGCANCHVPALNDRDGFAVDLYSDLLLHVLRKPVKLNERSKNRRRHFSQREPEETPGFRTAPLWGVADTAPYMHTGSAPTLHDAIMAHGVEGKAAREAYVGLLPVDQEALIAFLKNL